jgi:hypothetical protein
MINNDTLTPKTLTPKYSMKGMTFLPMPLGAIRLGHSIELPGGTLSIISDDEFKITKPERLVDGTWVHDELDGKLRESMAPQSNEGVAQRKLRAIPIRIHVNDPSLVVRSRLEAFDENGRTVCSSDGSGTAKRWAAGQGTVDVSCDGCDRCSFATSGQVECKFFGRIAVQIEGQSDALGTYVLRSGSYNTMRTFESKLWQLWSLFGNRLRGLPLQMTLRTAQTQLSNWRPFYFVDLTLADGLSLESASLKVQEQAASDLASGLDFDALASAMEIGLTNGGFLQDSVEDGVDLNEFVRASSFSSSVRQQPANDAGIAAGLVSNNSAHKSSSADASVSSVAFRFPVAGLKKAQSGSGAGAGAGGIFVGGFDPLS